MTYRKRTLTEMSCQAPRVNDPDRLGQFEMWFAEARAAGVRVPGGDGRGHGNAPRGSVGPDGAPEGGGRAGCRRTVVGLVGEGRGYAEAASELRSPFASPGRSRAAGALLSGRSTLARRCAFSQSLPAAENVRPTAHGRRSTILAGQFLTLTGSRLGTESSTNGSIPTAHWSPCKFSRPRKPRFPGLLESPLTDSNRRPPPYHALRSATGGNPRQRFWLVEPSWGFAICDRLPPVANA